MANKHFRGLEDVDERVRAARKQIQKIQGEAPPVNPAEASSDTVRVINSRDQPWRDYEGVKNVNPEGISYSDLLADSKHESDPSMQSYDPSEDYISNEEIGHATDIFQRMTGKEENLLEPSENRKEKSRSEQNYL